MAAEAAHAPAPAAFWCRTPSRPNLGDALTPWLVHRLTGVHPRFRRPEEGPTLLAGGSIVASARRGSTVWGAGIMSADDDISPEATLLAVRGPRTRRRALACGADCPEVYGDPALLLPRLHDRPVPRDATIGLVPHFSDRPRLVGPRDLPGWIRLVDVQGPVERTVDAIRSCGLVASSSLHGLIVAHAYGIPATWIELRPLPSGDRSKFLDYLESIGHRAAEPLRMERTSLDPALLRAHALDPPTRGDLDLAPLWETCPLRAPSPHVLGPRRWTATR